MRSRFKRNTLIHSFYFHILSKIIITKFASIACKVFPLYSKLNVISLSQVHSLFVDITIVALLFVVLVLILITTIVVSAIYFLSARRISGRHGMLVNIIMLLCVHTHNIMHVQHQRKYEMITYSNKNVF